MVFIYTYTLSKERWHISLRESKAPIAMDSFYIYKKKTLMKEYVQAVLNLQVLRSNDSALSHILFGIFA